MNAQPYHRFRNYLLLALLVLVQACQDKPKDQPENLIPEDKMAKILTEIHLAEARVSKLNMSSSDSSRLVYKRLEGQIFQKFKIDTTTYNQSYAYYSANSDKLGRIYKEVTETLEQRKKPSKLQ